MLRSPPVGMERRWLWRLHDFRRSGVTRLAGMGTDSIVVDKLLAHKPAQLKGIAAVYQRHEFMDERRRALEAWAAHLTRPPGATILPFRAADLDSPGWGPLLALAASFFA